MFFDVVQPQVAETLSRAQNVLATHGAGQPRSPYTMQMK